MGGKGKKGNCRRKRDTTSRGNLGTRPLGTAYQSCCRMVRIRRKKKPTAHRGEGGEKKKKSAIEKRRHGPSMGEGKQGGGGTKQKKKVGQADLVSVEEQVRPKKKKKTKPSFFTRDTRPKKKSEEKSRIQRSKNFSKTGSRRRE